MASKTTTLFYDMGKGDVDGIVFDLILEEHHALASTVTKHTVQDGSKISDHIHNELREGTLKGLISNYSLTTGKSVLDPSVARLIGPSVRRYFSSLASMEGAAIASAVGAASANAAKVSAVASSVGSMAISQLSLYPKPEEVKAAVGALPRPSNRARTTWELFKQLWTEKRPVVIVTGVESYRNVLVTGVTTTRDSNTGEALEFEVSFTEYLRASFKATSITAKVAPKLTEAKGQQASPNVNAGRNTGTGNKSEAAKKALTQKVGKK